MASMIRPPIGFRFLHEARPHRVVVTRGSMTPEDRHPSGVAERVYTPR
jgi:hypothetical protein